MTIAYFNKKPDDGVSDDIETEKAQATIVSKYWAERGYEVKVWIEALALEKMTVYCVRTDMVNGLPKGCKKGDKI